MSTIKGDDSTSTRIYLTDRSAAETDDRCGMRFWWNRFEGGKGIVAAEDDLALRIGKEVHEDLAFIAEMKDIRPEALQEVITDILSPIGTSDKIEREKMELAYRRAGWIAGFGLYVEPILRERYETIQIEGELVLDRDKLWVAVTPDRVLRNRQSHLIEYLEYKSTITANQKWMDSWPYMPQLHIGMAAISEDIEEKVAFAQVMGLMKGDQRTYGGMRRLHHPYVYGYLNLVNEQWEWDYQKARGADWIPCPIWEFPGGVVKWVQRVGEEEARSIFPMTQPIFFNKRLLDSWVARRLSRERRILPVVEECQTNSRLREVVFEQRTAQCRPAFGDACPYRLACWNAGVNADPLKSGEFIVRTPHHEVEIVTE